MNLFLLLCWRNCDELRFCSENINKTQPKVGIVEKSAKYSNSEYSANLKIDDSETPFSLHIYKIKDSGFRFRIDPGTDLSSYRFDITHDDLIINATTVSQKEELVFTQTEKFDVLLHNATNESCTISYSPFTVTFGRNGKQLISLNEHDFLFIERGEEVPPEEVAHQVNVDGEVKQVVSEVTTKHGKTGVGIDISFLSAKTRLSGFSEGTYPINLEDTGALPERRYALDSYSQYGFIPLLIAHCAEFAGLAPSIFWMNPTDMFIEIKTRSSERSTKLLAEGGFIDIVIFMDTMQETLKQYTLLTGVSPLPPIFALGYHQSKYGYESQEAIQTVVDKLEEFKFPNDVLWLDIDYLANHAPFTINYTWFPKPQEFFQQQLEKKRYVVRITDPHLPISLNHPQYNSAHELGYFELNSSNEEGHAECWPGISAWPDFFRKEVREWWAKQFSYDMDPTGWAENVYLWNDMNEISAFNQVDGTAPKDWLHFQGTIEERETHSGYGLSMVAASYLGLLQRDNYTRRPFILTRSFYAGSQKYTFYWSGDNNATWEHLQYSIEMALTAGINGIPLTGSDIGGFNSKYFNLTSELHVRWFQAGAYIYPFFRQHASNDSPHREPYLYNETDPAAFQAMRKAVEDRYKLIDVWYTAAYHHTQTSQPIVAPMWYHYPNDEQLHDVRFQSILDGKVLVCPAVYEGQTEVEVVKPEGKWYELWTGIELPESKSVPVTLEDVPVYLKGGSIIPVFNESAMTTRDQIQKPIILYIALDENQYAEGDLYLDDGISFNYTANSSVYVKFTYTNGHFEMKATGHSDSVKNAIVGMRIYGFSSSGDTEIGGTHSTDSNGVISITDISYNIDTSYETHEIGTDFPLWAIAVGVGVAMVILIIIAGIFVYRLNYKHKPPAFLANNPSMAASVNDPSQLLQSDATKTIL